MTAAATLRAAPMRRTRHLGLASFWFGLYFLYTPIGTNLIAVQVSNLVARGQQQVAQGLLLGAGAFVAMSVAPSSRPWATCCWPRATRLDTCTAIRLVPMGV